MDAQVVLTAPITMVEVVVQVVPTVRTIMVVVAVQAVPMVPITTVVEVVQAALMAPITTVEVAVPVVPTVLITMAVEAALVVHALDNVQMLVQKHVLTIVWENVEISVPIVVDKLVMEHATMVVTASAGQSVFLVLVSASVVVLGNALA